MTERNKVGEADPATRRRMLDAALNEPSKATGVAPRAAKPKPKKQIERRFGPKGKTVHEVVDEAVKGATPDPY
jgi:hypothetical protein